MSQQFRIISDVFQDRRLPVGIGHLKTAFQDVRLDSPVQTWNFKEVDDHIYQFSIGGYPYTGVYSDNKVTVSIYPEDDSEWHITYIEAKDAYTIEPAANQSRAWTVSQEYSSNPFIVIDEIKYDDYAFRYQLFQIEPVKE